MQCSYIKSLLFELSQGWKKKKCCFLQMCSSWLQCKIVERVADFYFISHKYLFLCLLQGHYYTPVILPYKLFGRPISSEYYILLSLSHISCLDTSWIQIIMHSDSTKPSNKDIYKLHLSESGMIFPSFFILFANSCKHTVLILLLHFIIFHSFSMKHMYEWVLVNQIIFFYMNTNIHGCIFINNY